MTISFTDNELVAKIQQGEILAFENLVTRYQDRVVNFAFRIVRDREIARDVAQEAFLKTYQAISRVDPTRKFSTFLFEVAKNTAISALRKTKREIPLTEEVAIEPKAGDEEGVREAVKILPGNYRAAVQLYYFSDLSYQEIAQKLKIPINTVRTNLRRAKERLRKMYAGRSV